MFSIPINTIDVFVIFSINKSLISSSSKKYSLPQRSRLYCLIITIRLYAKWKYFACMQYSFFCTILHFPLFVDLQSILSKILMFDYIVSYDTTKAFINFRYCFWKLHYMFLNSMSSICIYANKKRIKKIGFVVFELQESCLLSVEKITAKLLIG